MTMPVGRVARLVEGSPGALRSHGVRRAEASSPREGVGATSPPSAAEQLRALASRVRLMGLNGRFDPEAAFIERDELAHALRRLADRLESGAGHPPSATQASRPRVVLPRRFETVLSAKASEITSLRALLAQAVRPRRRRGRAAFETQLMLPLLEGANEG